MKAIFDDCTDFKAYEEQLDEKTENLIEQMKVLQNVSGKEDAIDLIAIYKTVLNHEFERINVEKDYKPGVLQSQIINSPQPFINALLKAWHTLDAHFPYPTLIPLPELFCFSEELDVSLVSASKYFKNKLQEIPRDEKDDDYKAREGILNDYIQKWWGHFDESPKVDKNNIDINFMEDHKKDRVLISEKVKSRMSTVFSQNLFLSTAINVFKEQGKECGERFIKITDGDYAKDCFASKSDCQWMMKYVIEPQNKVAKESDSFALQKKVPFLVTRGKGPVRLDLKQYVVYHKKFCQKYLWRVKTEAVNEKRIEAEAVVNVFWEDQIFRYSFFETIVNLLANTKEVTQCVELCKWLAKNDLKLTHYPTNIACYRERDSGSTWPIEDIDIQMFFDAYIQYLLKAGEEIFDHNGNRLISPTISHLEYVLKTDWEVFHQFLLQAKTNPQCGNIGTKEEYLRCISIAKELCPFSWHEIPMYVWRLLEIRTSTGFEKIKYDFEDDIAYCSQLIVQPAVAGKQYMQDIATMLSDVEKKFFCISLRMLGKEDMKTSIENNLNVLLVENSTFKYTAPIIEHTDEYERILNYAILHSSDHKK